MNPSWIIRAPRLVLTPVGWRDLYDLQAIKADPRVFAVMLGGVRGPARSAEELAEDISSWPRNGYGMFSARSTQDEAFLGVTGLMLREDGRGVALRFAFWPEVQGRGLAREAAGSVLRFGHDAAGLDRIVAVARESNFASRTILGGIGMVQCEDFLRDGHAMVMYQSLRHR
jgi:RimJ/RimL family protein N-acetyltransferase